MYMHTDLNMIIWAQVKALTGTHGANNRYLQKSGVEVRGGDTSVEEKMLPPRAANFMQIY